MALAGDSYIRIAITDQYAPYLDEPSYGGTNNIRVLAMRWRVIVNELSDYPSYYALSTGEILV